MSELPALLQAVATLRTALDDLNALNAEGRAIERRMHEIKSETRDALAALYTARNNLITVARGTHDRSTIIEAEAQVRSWEESPGDIFRS